MKAIVVKKGDKNPLLLWEEVPDIQMAREAGALVYITAGAEEKLEKCRALGAALALNYKEQDFFEEVQAAHAYVRENRNTGKVILEVSAAS